MRGLKAIAAVLLLASGTAHAQFSGTANLTSDYDFRGISLSAEDLALQGSIDWAHDSGLYLGAWASNIDYGPVDGDIEVDLYVGFSGGSEDSFLFDAGIVYYTYPDSNDIEEYPEIYAGLTFGPFEVKQWYTNDYAGTDLDALYTEGNFSFELPRAFTLSLHAGYNYGDAFDTVDSEYFDYSVGVGYTLQHFDLLLRWVDTDLDEGDFFFSSDDLFNSEGRVILSVSTSFPWSSE